jgi:hypothetical protein
MNFTDCMLASALKTPPSPAKIIGKKESPILAYGGWKLAYASRLRAYESFIPACEPRILAYEHCILAYAYRILACERFILAYEPLILGTKKAKNTILLLNHRQKDVFSIF